jgi:hypothetical protein
MKAAVEGSGLFGEMVEQMIKSSCWGVIPAISSALREACTESVDVVSCGAAWRRSLIPVRSVIHWSEVSTIFSRSWLVITFFGSVDPVPKTPERCIHAP